MRHVVKVSSSQFKECIDITRDVREIVRRSGATRRPAAGRQIPVRVMEGLS